MRRLVTAVFAAALAAPLFMLAPAAASHTETAEYTVSNPTRGYGTVRNMPNPLGLLGTEGKGVGGYIFSNLKHDPQHLTIFDSINGSNQLSYSVCQPNCDGTRITGCTPPNGRVPLTLFKGGQDLQIFIYNADPVLNGCENNAIQGTLTLKFK